LISLGGVKNCTGQENASSSNNWPCRYHSGPARCAATPRPRPHRVMAEPGAPVGRPGNSRSPSYGAAFAILFAWPLASPLAAIRFENSARAKSHMPTQLFPPAWPARGCAAQISVGSWSPDASPAMPIGYDQQDEVAVSLRTRNLALLEPSLLRL